MESAKQDADALLNNGMSFAEQLLANYVEFFPFGRAMGPLGEVVSVAAYDGREQPPSQDVIDLLKIQFRDGAESGKYEATALFYDVRINLPDDGGKGDAVAVAIDHRDNYSVVVLLPYTLQNGQVAFGEVSADEGEYGVFGRGSAPGPK